MAPPQVSVALFATSPSTLQYSTASMISLSLGLCRSRGGYCRRSSIWWLFQLNRFLGVHRPKQHVGMCDNFPHSTLFTALLSPSWRHWSINRYYQEKQVSKLQTSPSTTTRRCTRRFLISCRDVPIELDTVQMYRPREIMCALVQSLGNCQV